VFDCVNVRYLLPVDDYAPGATLPPHFSPFVEEKEGDYISIQLVLWAEMGGNIALLSELHVVCYYRRS